MSEKKNALLTVTLKRGAGRTYKITPESDITPPNTVSRFWGIKTTPQHCIWFNEDAVESVEIIEEKE